MVSAFFGHRFRFRVFAFRICADRKVSRDTDIEAYKVTILFVRFRITFVDFLRKCQMAENDKRLSLVHANARGASAFSRHVCNLTIEHFH